MPEIEFVDPESDTGADEELAVGPRRAPASSRLRVVIAAVAVLAAATVVGTLARGSADRHAAPSTASPAPAVLPTVAQAIPALPADGYTESIGPPDCVGVRASRCRFEVGVPTDVVRAITAQFGAVTFLRVMTLVGTGRSAPVRSRTVAGQAGEVNVQIDIRPATAREGARSGTSYVGAFATVYATELHNGVAVSVSVSGVQTQTPSVVTVTALAADRRLLATD